MGKGSLFHKEPFFHANKTKRKKISDQRLEPRGKSDNINKIFKSIIEVYSFLKCSNIIHNKKKSIKKNQNLYNMGRARQAKSVFLFKNLRFSVFLSSIA